MRVWLVEVWVKDRWLPMYTVCYSMEEAIGKAKSKKGIKTRVRAYEPDPYIKVVEVAA